MLNFYILELPVSRIFPSFLYLGAILWERLATHYAVDGRRLCNVLKNVEASIAATPTNPTFLHT